MKSQLASVVVIAAVACGGRGAEEPPVVVAGTTDVPQTQGPVPVDDAVDTPESAEDRLPVGDRLDAPQPAKAPVTIAGERAWARPGQDPGAVDDSAEAQPSMEKRWRARAPEQYVITTCSYGAAPPSCALDAVEAGRLVSRSTRFLPGEPWVPAPTDGAQEPVASLFDQARRSTDGCTTSFELDPVYAYPSQVYVDCEQEGWGVRVTCFEPDTLDGSRCQ